MATYPRTGAPRAQPHGQYIPPSSDQAAVEAFDQRVAVARRLLNRARRRASLQATQN